MIGFCRHCIFFKKNVKVPARYFFCANHRGFYATDKPTCVAFKTKKNLEPKVYKTICKGIKCSRCNECRFAQESCLDKKNIFCALHLKSFERYSTKCKAFRLGRAIE